MKRYIALLRGINVGGHKKILMTDLKALFESLGYVEVHTYIQSGNVVFNTSESNRLATNISDAIREKYGWEVPVLVCTATELEEVLAHCPFSEEKKVNSYFTLFQQEPSEEHIKAVNEWNFPGEEFYITPSCLYYFSETGYARVKMNGQLLERKLQVSTTSRNYRTMVKLLEMAGNS